MTTCAVKRREPRMYAVAHIAMGYLAAKLIDQTTKQKSNIPIIWTLAIIPDIDLLIPGIKHRGPTHSIIMIALVFTPLLIIMKEKAAPYFLATAIHPFADYLTKGGVQLLWPLSQQWIQYKYALSMTSAIETQIELTLFFTLIGTIIISKDYKNILNSNSRKTLLLIPLFTILLPLTLKYPITIPKTLIIPHIIVLSIGTIPILMSLRQIISKQTKNRPKTPKL